MISHLNLLKQLVLQLKTIYLINITKACYLYSQVIKQCLKIQLIILRYSKIKRYQLKINGQSQQLQVFQKRQIIEKFTFKKCLCSYVIQLFIEHNNLKKMTFSMATLPSNLFQEQNQAYSITLSTLFPNQIDNNDQLQQLHVFQSTTLEQHMNFLKRYHLSAKNVPEIKLLGGFHKNIEITMRVYDKILLQQIKRYTHQEKLDCCLQLLKTYRTLVKEYGYFLITHNHIKVDCHNTFAIWINQDFTLNYPSLPILIANERTELFVVGEFIKIIKQFFTTDFFKYRKIQSFNQLETYLEFVKKRNSIHKNCGARAREESENKRRITLSVKNLRNNSSQKIYDSCSNKLGSFSTLLGSNILSHGSRQKYPSESFINSSSMSRIQASKGSSDSKQMKSQVDTTIISSELMNNRNMSYLQLSNIIKKSQKKSCVFGSNPQKVQENTIKHSSVMKRKCEKQKINTRFCPIQYKRKTEKERQKKEAKPYKSSSLQKKNTLQIGLNNLLLSQINEDPENQTGGSDLKRRQHLIEEFQSLLCN